MMHQPIPNSSPIATRLRRAGVSAVILFGSQATGTAGPLSDTDLGVLLAQPVPRQQLLHRTAELEGLLSELFPSLRHIQVTIVNLAPIELQLAVLKRGQLLVVLDEEALANFREYVTMRAGDLLPMIRAFRHTRLEGLRHGAA